jgi:hypothetical protein
VVIDTRKLTGSLDVVGEGRRRFTPAKGARVLAKRPARKDVKPHAKLPEDTRLWALLQQAGGGTWGGCVYDADAVAAALGAGKARRPGTRTRGAAR